MDSRLLERPRDLTTTCPGALPLAGPDPRGPSVICGPLALDRSKDAFGAMGDEDNVVFTSLQHPSTVYAACCGDYTQCEIWREEKERVWDLRYLLERPAEED